MKNINEMTTALNSKKLLIPFFITVTAVSVGTITSIVPDSIKWIMGTLTLAVIILFALRSPFYAFLIFVLTLPLEATLVIELGFTVRPSYIALLFTYFVLVISRKNIGSFKSPLNTPILLYMSVALLSLAMTFVYAPPQVALIEPMKYRGTSFRSIIQLIVLIFYVSGYFLTIYFCSDKKRILTVLKVYIGMAFFLSIYGIYQVLAVYYNLPFQSITNALSTSGEGYGGPFKGIEDLNIFRSYATFQEPLNFGHYLLSSVPLLIVVYLFRKKADMFKGKFVSRYIGFIAILAGITALCFTRSRGALIGLVGSVLLIMMLMGKLRDRIKLIAVLTGISILILIAFETIFGQVDVNTFRLDKGSLASDPRWSYVLSTIEFCLERPITWILGTGIGNYGLHSAAVFRVETLGSANSLPLQILVETGGLGFVAFLFLMIRYYSYMFHALKNSGGTTWYPYVLGYIASFTGMMIQHLIFADRLPLYLWVFVGISIATARIIEMEESFRKSLYFEARSRVR